MIRKRFQRFIIKYRFIGYPYGYPLFFTQEVRYQEEMYIDTLEGKMRADVGDYIIRGVSNEYYPCKPDIFHMTYDIVDKEQENVNDQKKIIPEDNTIR